MRKCFISYKKEDTHFKQFLISHFEADCFIDKSLDKTIDSEDGEYILQVIRDEYLSDSTVTLFLIGEHSSENEGVDHLGDKNFFIKRELAASLHNGKGNTRNGIIGIVLPSMYSRIFKGQYLCNKCGNYHNYVDINDSTVIREFSYNYYVEPHQGCAWSEEQRYCILVKWDDFINNPENYIESAFNKRNTDLVNKIRIRNLRE